MIALTINIPDWLIDGPFWTGFIIGAFLTIVILMVGFRNIGPRF